MTKSPFNKYLYISFILLGFYQSFFNHEFVDGASSVAIGLIFDPFDPEKKWNDRSALHKAILFIHLGVAAAMLGYGIGVNDR